ncbi:MAG: hypothetical protein H6577_17580 [Lewinellaceae bacterium]|nr:hypothetical protein [Lewinellaceae bacterium]
MAFSRLCGSFNWLSSAAALFEHVVEFFDAPTADVKTNDLQSLFKTLHRQSGEQAPDDRFFFAMPAGADLLYQHPGQADRVALFGLVPASTIVRQDGHRTELDPEGSVRAACPVIKYLCLIDMEGCLGGKGRPQFLATGKFLVLVGAYQQVYVGCASCLEHFIEVPFRSHMSTAVCWGK